MPNDSDKEHMHYTMATMYEVLRYTSPAGLSLPHRASKDQNFEGYFVHKDSIIIPNHWYIHHDPNCGMNRGFLNRNDFWMMQENCCRWRAKNDETV